MEVGSMTESVSDSVPPATTRASSGEGDPPGNWAAGTSLDIATVPGSELDPPGNWAAGTSLDLATTPGSELDPPGNWAAGTSSDLGTRPGSELDPPGNWAPGTPAVIATIPYNTASVRGGARERLRAAVKAVQSSTPEQRVTRILALVEAELALAGSP